jgi:hypothetical protein
LDDLENLFQEPGVNVGDTLQAFLIPPTPYGIRQIPEAIGAGDP